MFKNNLRQKKEEKYMSKSHFEGYKFGFTDYTPLKTEQLDN